MNPFSINIPTISSLKIFCQNIRSLCLPQPKILNKKITTILSANADIYILVDIRAEREDIKQLFNSPQFKYRLGHLKWVCSPSNPKGILVMYNHKTTSVRNCQFHTQGQLFGLEVRVNNEWVNFVPVYAPPDKDDPGFLINTKTLLDSMSSEQGVILGDFNSTIDPTKDRKGYTTDNHKKSRTVLRTWTESEELIDVFRTFEPEESIFTYRTKDGSRQSRLDYVLATPGLIPNITTFSHRYYGYDHSDHSASIFQVDFEKAERGPGVFRAHPSLLKYPSYKTQMMAAIRSKILENLQDKTSEVYTKNIKLSQEKEDLEKRLTYIRTHPNWHANPQVKEIEIRIKIATSHEDPTEFLLQQNLTTQPEFILDSVVNEMKNVTQKFAKSIKLARKDKHELLNAKLDELNNIVSNPQCLSEMVDLEMELKLLTEEIIQDEASVHRAYHLLNECKITPQFLSLEKRKTGYSNIVRLTNSEGNIVTNPKEIRQEMSNFYQNFYKKQDLSPTVDNIEKFLCSDDDQGPLKEARSRQIPNDIRDDLETELSKEELTEALMKHMKPNSAPGIDGFSVKFIREFWPNLADLVWMSFINMKKKENLQLC